MWRAYRLIGVKVWGLGFRGSGKREESHTPENKEDGFEDTGLLSIFLDDDSSIEQWGYQCFTSVELSGNSKPKP